jgi:glycosyltransferase involved in cell wall biosynthesis
VRPGEHGWLVPASDVEELMCAMQACLDTSADTLARMGVASHERVRALHSVETQAVELAELFQHSIDGGR